MGLGAVGEQHGDGHAADRVLGDDQAGGDARVPGQDGLRRRSAVHPGHGQVGDHEVVRLGHGVDRTGVIDPVAMERTLAASFGPDLALQAKEIVRLRSQMESILARHTGQNEDRVRTDIERDTIRFAISHYRGQMSEVARRLKIGRSTLYRKLDEIVHRILDGQFVQAEHIGDAFEVSDRRHRAARLVRERACGRPS